MREARIRAQEEEEKRKKERIKEEKREQIERKFWISNLNLDKPIHSLTLDCIRDKIHPDQKLFAVALDKAFLQYPPRNPSFKKKLPRDVHVIRYTLDVPLKFIDNTYYLVRLHFKHWGGYTRINTAKKIGKYQGQALNPLISSINADPDQSPDPAIRKTALTILYKEFKIASINFPFSPRQMDVLKYCYHHSEMTSGGVGEALGIAKSSVRTIKVDILSRARKFLPENLQFSQKINGQKPEAKVVALYWWNQGFCFDTA